MSNNMITLSTSVMRNPDLMAVPMDGETCSKDVLKFIAQMLEQKIGQMA